MSRGFTRNSLTAANVSQAKTGPLGKRLSGSANHRVQGSQPAQSNNRIQGYSSGFGNYTNVQMPSTLDINIENIYPSNKYLPQQPYMRDALYRQIYRHDSTAGMAVELYINLLFGPFSLSGVKDRTILQAYEDSMTNLGMERRLPELALDWMVLGKFCTHLIFSESKGVWDNMIHHDPSYIRVTPIPLVDAEPILHLVPPPDLKNMAARLLTTKGFKMDDSLRNILSVVATQNAIQLNNENTFYFPRKAGHSDYYGTSIYSRILHLVLIESALMNANLVNAYRRAGPIRVITPRPQSETLYSPEQLDALAMMFMEADEDPASSTIVLREAVDITTLGSANSDQWRAFDDFSTIQTSKLNAMGYSESLITGEASYGTTEINLSVFLERVKAIRTLFTRDYLIHKVCRTLAIAMDFRKTTQARLDHRIVVKSKDDSDLILPHFQWHNNLSPISDPNFIDNLEKAEEKGIPVSLTTWASALSLDLSKEVESMPQDARIRDEIAKYKTPAGSTTANIRMDNVEEFRELKDVVKDMKDGGKFGEFRGDLTPYNFQLLTVAEMKRALVAYRDDTMEQLPSHVYIAFQLFLKAKDLPFRELNAAEFDKLEIDLARLENDHPELGEYLRSKLPGISPAAVQERVDDVAADQGQTLDTENTETIDKRVSVEDGTLTYRTDDKAGDKMTQDLRRRQQRLSDDDITQEGLTDKQNDNDVDTSGDIAQRLEDMRQRLENMEFGLEPEEVLKELGLNVNELDDEVTKDRLDDATSQMETELDEESKQDISQEVDPYLQHENAGLEELGDVADDPVLQKALIKIKVALAAWRAIKIKIVWLRQKVRHCAQIEELRELVNKERDYQAQLYDLEKKIGVNRRLAQKLEELNQMAWQLKVNKLKMAVKKAAPAALPSPAATPAEPVWKAPTITVSKRPNPYTGETQ